MKRATYSKMVLSFCLASFLSGCSFNPFSAHNEGTGQAIGGAMVGAGIGAGIAGLIGASKTAIAVAGIGGGVAGYYASTLRYAASGIYYAGGQVYTLGDSVSIYLPTDHLFDTNSSELLPGTEPILQSVADVLDRYPNNNILITGNTSGFGSQRFQRALSEARAREVAAYLWAHGISNFQDQSIETRRLIYVGYGDYFPVANNIHNVSIRMNSRIQITAYPCKEALYGKERYKLFSNVGCLGEVRPRSTCDCPNGAFDSGEALDERPTRGVRGNTPGHALDETQAKTTVYSEQIPPSHNIGCSVSQTNAGGSVPKQGGYKGEGISFK